MNRETVDLIAQLASRLGTTADHLWSVLLAQAAFEARVDLAYGIAWGVVGLIAASLIVIAISKAKGYTNEGWFILAIICGFALLFAVPLSCICFQASYTEFHNPEFWALKQIFGK